jgi:hypothetical protein
MKQRRGRAQRGVERAFRAAPDHQFTTAELVGSCYGRRPLALPPPTCVSASLLGGLLCRCATSAAAATQNALADRVASAHACGNYCAYSAVYCVRAAFADRLRPIWPVFPPIPIGAARNADATHSGAGVEATDKIRRSDCTRGARVHSGASGSQRKGR